VVPSVFGKTRSEAEGILSDSGLRVSSVLGDTGDASTVAEQSIPPGTQVQRNTEVNLTMAAPASPAQTNPPATIATGSPPQQSAGKKPQRISVPMCICRESCG